MSACTQTAIHELNTRDVVEAVLLCSIAPVVVGVKFINMLMVDPTCHALSFGRGVPITNDMTS
jgi:hypothetical protein